MIASGRFDVTALLLVATTGNTLGAVVNWGLGRTIETFRNRRWFPVSAETLRRGEAVYECWGKWSLLLSWAPVIGDALTLAAGVLRVKLTSFVILVLIAKGGRYLVVAGLLQALS